VQKIVVSTSPVDNQDKYDWEALLQLTLVCAVSFNSFFLFFFQLGLVKSIRSLLDELKLDANLVFQYNICYINKILILSFLSGKEASRPSKLVYLVENQV
jgi:hypothetical protein